MNWRELLADNLFWIFLVLGGLLLLPWNRWLKIREDGRDGPEDPK